MIIKHIPNLFEPAKRDEREVPFEGLTLAEILSKNFGMEHEGMVALVNSGQTPWDYIPCANDEVIFVKDVTGKFAGSVIGAIIGVALIAVGTFVPGAQFLVPYGVAFLAGAVVGAAASLLFNPKTPDGATGGFANSQTYSWGGISNLIGEGNAVPVVYGEHRMGGVVVEAYIDGFNDVNGDRKDYMNVVLALSEGEIHSIDTNSILINNKPLADYDPDYTLETRLGTNNQTQVNENIAKYYALNNSVKIVHSTPYVYRTFGKNSKTIVHLTLPSLYVVSGSGIANNTVELIVSTARGDAPTVWTQMPYATHQVWVIDSPGYWNYAPEFGDGYVEWVAEVGHWATQNLPCTHSITKSSRSEVILDIEIPGYAGATETLIKIERLTADIPDGSVSSSGDLYIKGATEYEHGVAPAYNSTAVLGLRLLATNKISGAMPSITAKMVGRKILDVRDLVALPTVAGAKNPANILYDFLLNPLYGMGNAMSAAKIDLASFQDFADWCDEVVNYTSSDKNGNTTPKTQKRYEMNLVLDSQHKLDELIQQICGVCRATPYWSGDKLRIVVDRPQTVYSQIFNMANIVKDSFEETYIGLNQIANQVEVQFLDETDEYKRHTMVAIDTARVGEDVISKTVQLYGITDSARAKREVTFAMKKAKGTRRLIKFATTIQALVTEVGDMFHFQHDVPQYGFGGNIIGKSGNTITFDKNVYLTNGQQHGCRVQKADGTLLYYTTAAFGGSSGEYSSVTFLQAIDGGVTQDDLYSFGPITKETKPFILNSAIQQENGIIAITASEYNESVFSDDESIDVTDTKYSSLGLVESYTFDGTLPPGTATPSGLTPEGSGLGTEREVPPFVTDVALSEHFAMVGGAYLPVILVNFADVVMSRNSIANISRYDILFRESDATGWATVGSVGPGVCSFQINNGIEVGKIYFVVVKPYTNYGVTNNIENDPNYNRAFQLKIFGTINKPLPPTGLLLDYAKEFEIGIKWTPTTDIDVSAIQIWASATSVWDNATLVGTVPPAATRFAHTGLTFDTNYWYWIRSVNTNVVYPGYSDLEGPLATATTATPAGLLNALTTSLTESELSTELQAKVNVITPEDLTGIQEDLELLAELQLQDGDRYDSAEMRITEAEAKIELKAEHITVADHGARLSKAEVDIDGAEAAILLKASQSELDTVSGVASGAASAAGTAQAAADAAQADADTAQATANAAQVTADAAQADATTALGKLADIASDAKITPVEKLSAKMEWDAIVAEGTPTTGTIPTQATLFSVPDTDFDSMYSALDTYLNTTLTVFADMAATTTITRSAWDTAWKNYYDARTNLLNTIAAKARTLANDAQSAADAAQGSANTAISNAATAQAAAEAAQSAADAAQGTANTAAGNATTALNALTDIASDNQLTGLEKQATKKEWDEISGAKSGNDAQADVFSVSRTAYDAAYSALDTYLNTGSPALLADLTTTSAITGSTFRSMFTDYYNAEGTLLRAIATAAKAIADQAQADAETLAGIVVDMVSRVSLAEVLIDGANAKIELKAERITVADHGARISKAEVDIDGAEAAILLKATQEDLGITNGNVSTAQAAAEAAQADATQALSDAATAQSTANAADAAADAAQADADTANGLLDDIASDNKLTPVEKQNVKLEWDSIGNEKPRIDSEATSYGISTEKTNFDNSYITLSDYISPLLSDLNATSDITGTTFRTNFADYYDKRTLVLNAISTAAKGLADAAQSDADTAISNAATAQGAADAAQGTANTAISNAATAQAAAEAAQSDADAAQGTANTAASNATTALNTLSDIASDSQLTAVEKQATKKEWDEIAGAKSGNDTQADTFGVSRTTYDAAYSTLDAYLNTGSPSLLADLATTSAITGSTFRTNFTNYYNAEGTMLRAIAAAAKTLADQAQTDAETLAGIVLDLGVRISGAEILIDGANAEITLKASRVGLNAVAAEMTLAANQWTVKINGNGHIAGVGLLLDPLSGASDFIILADRFAVMKPDGTGTPEVPFIVGTIDGVTQVGIDGNLVVDGSIYARSLKASTITADKLSFNNLAGLNSTEGAKLSGIADSATKNIVTHSTLEPSLPTDGDIWVDTSVSPNLVKMRVAGVWQTGANYSTNTNQLTDGANLGGTATWSGVSGSGKPSDNATSNTLYRQATEPTGGTYTTGDLWIDTDATPVVVYQWSGTVWTQISNYSTNTNQLTDGAGLGNTALWSGVSGTGKPANYATVGATWGTNITNQPSNLSGINSTEGSKLAGIATGADVTLSAINGGLSVTGGGLTLSSTATIDMGYTAPGDNNTTPGAGFKVSSGKIEAYGADQTFGGTVISSDGNYMVSIGKHLTATGLGKRHPLNNATNFVTDGQIHVYFWDTVPVTDTWVEVANIGNNNSSSDYYAIRVWNTGSRKHGIYATVDSATAIGGTTSSVSGYGVVGEASNGGTGGYFYVSGGTGGTPLRIAPSMSASAPSHSAAKGSLWVTFDCILYINTNGYTTWQKVGAQ